MNRIARFAAVSVALALLAVPPLHAQDTTRDAEVPRTRTLPGVKAPAFPYAQPKEVGLSSEKLERLGDEITEWVANGDLVGAELLIIKDGKAVVHEAYGWSDREERRPMERGSIFDIKSMTKPVTATAILMLAEDGKLSLDDPVRRYIPTFPDDSTTIRHLLSQTSGFDVTDEIRPADAYDFESLRAWVDVLVMDKRPVPLGTFRYTDYNYNFLGQIVEEVSGLRIDAFTEEHILRPLTLEETFTSFEPTAPWAERVPSRYRWDEDVLAYRRVWARGDEQGSPFYTAASGLFSTAMDFATFMAMWMNKGEWGGTRLLSEDTVEEALRLHGFWRAERGYGYGWNIQDAPRADCMPPIFSHSGIDGTIALAFPAAEAIVVYFTHSLPAQSRLHLWALMNRLGMLGILEQPVPYLSNMVWAGGQDVADVELTPDERASYIGTYRGRAAWAENGFVARVWEEEGHLHYRLGRLGEPTDLHFHLVPHGEHRFAVGRYRGEHLEVIDPDGSIRFTVENGRATAVEGRVGPLMFSAGRADPAQVRADIEALRNRVRIDEVVSETLEAEGIESARVLHRTLRASTPDSVWFREGFLNRLGYQLLSEGRVEEAIAVFEMNVKAYPEAPNPYDSLGDAYSAAGRLEDAKHSYERAVELAEQQGHESLPAYRANLERITQQLENER